MNIDDLNNEFFATQSQTILYLKSLWDKALSENFLQSLFALLALTNNSVANWDPYDEAIRAADDVNWLRTKAREERSESCAVRLSLMSYCQVVETSEIHRSVMNLLRCLESAPYLVDPFFSLRRNQRTSPNYVPPSAKQKYRFIKEQATRVGEHRIIDLIEFFFNEELRNAFSHADYILTDDEFRYTEGKGLVAIPLEEVIRRVNAASSFHNALLISRAFCRQQMAKMPASLALDENRMMEILADGGLITGFSITGSSSKVAMFNRTPKGTVCQNIVFTDTGIELTI